MEDLAKLFIRNVDFFYGQKHALKSISMEIPKQQITTIIGPSGCGKTTLLRILNRLHEHTPDARFLGDVLMDGQSIYAANISATELRRNIGMLFQKPAPFPMSIFDNVAYGPRILGISDKQTLQEIVEGSLRDADLWEEVKQDLHKSGRQLSDGQQQRLCIARALAVVPDVLLLDEPCSALDPTASEVIEQLLCRLKREFTIVVVTHSLGQARRISDWIAFLMDGELIEFGRANQVFTNPQDSRTAGYLNGKFG